MAGIFSKSSRPKLPGAFFNFVAELAVQLQASVGSIVAIPLVHDWGPQDQAVVLNSFEEWEAVYGKGDTAGRRAALQAFLGEGLPGKAGAGAVLAYRMAGAAAASATKTLQNTTPVNAITLTARYSGSRGNALKITVQPTGAVGEKEVVVLDGAQVLERFPHAETDITALADDITANSDWITAAMVATGVALVDISGTTMTGGNDGSTLLGGDWTDMMNALEFERYSILSPYDLTDGTIRTSLMAWIEALNERGKRVLAVIGGAAGENAATANARSAAINQWDVVNLGLGTVVHEALASDGTDVTLSTSQLAPRLAGIIASRGETKDLFIARFAGLSFSPGVAVASIADNETAIDSGTTVLSRDGYQAAPLRILEGVTTYATEVDAARPVSEFRRIKNVRIMHGFELEITDWAETENVLGDLPVNDRVRDFIRGEAQARLDARVGREILQPGATVEIDTDPPPSDDQDFIQLGWSWGFVRSLRQLYSTIKINA